MTEDKMIKQNLYDQFKWREGKKFVFVSYASADWKQVYPIVLELQNRGYNIFIDKEFERQANRNWNRKMKDSIGHKLCKGMITFLSVNSLKSYAVLIEQGYSATKVITKRFQRFKQDSIPNFYVTLDFAKPQDIASCLEEFEENLTGEEVEMMPNEISFMEDVFEEHFDKDGLTELKEAKNNFDIACLSMDYYMSLSDFNFIKFSSSQECADKLSMNFSGKQNTDINLTPDPAFIVKKENLSNANIMNQNLSNKETEKIQLNEEKIMVEDDNNLSDFVLIWGTKMQLGKRDMAKAYVAIINELVERFPNIAAKMNGKIVSQNNKSFIGDANAQVREFVSEGSYYYVNVHSSTEKKFEEMGELAACLGLNLIDVVEFSDYETNLKFEQKYLEKKKQFTTTINNENVKNEVQKESDKDFENIQTPDSVTIWGEKMLLGKRDMAKAYIAIIKAMVKEKRDYLEHFEGTCISLDPQGFSSDANAQVKSFSLNNTVYYVNTHSNTDKKLEELSKTSIELGIDLITNVQFSDPLISKKIETIVEDILKIKRTVSVKNIVDNKTNESDDFGDITISDIGDTTSENLNVLTDKQLEEHNNKYGHIYKYSCEATDDFDFELGAFWDYKTELWGLRNANNVLVVPAKYKNVIPGEYVRHGFLFLAENEDGKYGVINDNNEIILPFTLTSVKIDDLKDDEWFKAKPTEENVVLIFNYDLRYVYESKFCEHNKEKFIKFKSWLEENNDCFKNSW